MKFFFFWKNFWKFFSRAKFFAEIFFRAGKFPAPPGGGGSRNSPENGSPGAPRDPPLYRPLFNALFLKCSDLRSGGVAERKNCFQGEYHTKTRISGPPPAGAPPGDPPRGPPGAPRGPGADFRKFRAARRFFFPRGKIFAGNFFFAKFFSENFFFRKIFLKNLFFEKIF